MTIRTVTFQCALMLGLTAPATGHAGWLDAWNARRDDCAPCTRHSAAETRGEHERSKHLQHLDCAGLTAYAESQRLQFNQRTFATYTRFPTVTLSEPLAPATVPPTPTSSTPATEPATPPPVEGSPPVFAPGNKPR